MPSAASEDMRVFRSIQRTKSNLFAQPVELARCGLSLKCNEYRHFRIACDVPLWNRNCPLSARSKRVKLLYRLKMPASESQLAITLAVSLVFMAAMLVGLLWQANIIAFQKEIIRSLWDLKNAS